MKQQSTRKTKINFNTAANTPKQNSHLKSFDQPILYEGISKSAIQNATSEYNQKLEKLLNRIQAQNRYSNRVTVTNLAHIGQYTNLNKLQQVTRQIQQIKQARKIEQLNEVQLRNLNSDLNKQIKQLKQDLQLTSVSMLSLKKQLKIKNEFIHRLQKQNIALQTQILSLKRKSIQSISQYKINIYQDMLDNRIKQFLAEANWKDSLLIQFCRECVQKQQYSNFFVRLEKKLQIYMQQKNKHVCPRLIRSHSRKVYEQVDTSRIKQKQTCSVMTTRNKIEQYNQNTPRYMSPTKKDACAKSEDFGTLKILGYLIVYITKQIQKYQANQRVTSETFNLSYYTSVITNHKIVRMGNKIGFEADSESVKLAYVQEDLEHIKFIQGLNSKFLKSQIKWSNAIIFLFQCSIQEFLSYHTSQNVGLLRSEYQKLLSASELVIRTNRTTINILNQNKQLENALKDILMKKFKLEHTERIQNSVNAMHILQKNFHQFFKFKHIFSITQLHNFHSNFQQQKHLIKHLPQKFVLVILRNGITAYKIQKGKKTERVDGSVIGEKTIMSILKFKYPKKNFNQLFQIAFSHGDLKQVDLMVEDIYGKNSHNLGLPGQIIASSMGKIAKMSPAEMSGVSQSSIVRSLITTFAINTANLISLYLQKSQFNTAIVLADIFHNDKFYSLVQSISASYAPGKTICFSNHAPFMGCLGTAFNNYLQRA